MAFSERVNIFGDIVGINAAGISIFLAATADHLYGGAYPNREQGIKDEDVIKKNGKLLAEAGILNPSPIIPCASIEERVTQILQACNRHKMEKGIGLYWIVERDPRSFLDVVKSRLEKESLQPDILRNTTLVRLGLEPTFDHSDEVTGIRITTFPPTPYRFPFHPTLAS